MVKLVLGLLLLTAAGAAEAMPVADFLAKADALRKKGPMALFSSDVGLLKAEIVAGGRAARADQVAARKAGRRPATCMPARAAVQSDELLAYFRAIPPERRSMDAKDAFAGLLRKKYPCPA